MTTGSADTDIVIIGAGAAGLGAAKRCAALGLSFRVLEASHRVGGRAYTEFIGPKRQPFDLGCHWMHSASLNPLVRIADQFGFNYDTGGWGRLRVVGDRFDAEDPTDWYAFDEMTHGTIASVPEEGPDAAVVDLTPRDDFWTPFWDYVLSIHTSFDPDQVSAVDFNAYNDTEEDWPVQEGLGELLRRFAADTPVELNTQVTRLDWSGSGVKAETPRGTVNGRAAIVTVSTGILGAGDILFDPALPEETQQAIHDLPLGGHNRIALVFDAPVFGDSPANLVAVLPDQDDDVQMTFRVNPFGYDYAVGVTGGRYSDWLERAGEKASVDLAMEKLKKAFGSAIGGHLIDSCVSAWRGDPWIKGAYSGAKPGRAEARKILATPLDNKLFFAGEATHASFYSTCHGAYLTGIDAAEAAAGTLSAPATARSTS